VRNLGCQVLERQCRNQANDSVSDFGGDGDEIGIAQRVGIGEPVQSALAITTQQNLKEISKIRA